MEKFLLGIDNTRQIGEYIIDDVTQGLAKLQHLIRSEFHHFSLAQYSWVPHPLNRLGIVNCPIHRLLILYKVETLIV